MGSVPERDDHPAPEGLSSRILRTQQDQGTILARLQFELEAHVKDTSRPLSDFFRLVMDPEKGAIVRIGRIEVAISALENSLMKRALDINKIPGIDERLATIEDAREGEAKARGERIHQAELDRKGRRQWLLRDVLAVGIGGIIVAVTAAVITAKLLGA